MPVDRRRRDDFLQSAETSLRTARLALDGDDPAGAVMQAENAARLALNALASHDGVRIVGAHRHEAAIRFAEFRPDAFDGRSVDGLDALRRTRNDSMYGDNRTGEAPQAPAVETAAGAIDVAERTISRVRQLTRPTIPPPPPGQ